MIFGCGLWELYLLRHYLYLPVLLLFHPRVVPAASETAVSDGSGQPRFSLPSLPLPSRPGRPRAADRSVRVSMQERGTGPEKPAPHCAGKDNLERRSGGGVGNMNALASFLVVHSPAVAEPNLTTLAF